MNRTINERKAGKIISLSLLLNFISLFFMLQGIRGNMIIIFTLGLVGWYTTLMGLFYGAYSLGWEYKRMDLNDAYEVQDE